MYVCCLQWFLYVVNLTVLGFSLLQFASTCASDCLGRSFLPRGALHNFHKNRARDLPLRGEKFRKCCTFGVFAAGNPQVLLFSSQISCRLLLGENQNWHLSRPNFNTSVSAGSNNCRHWDICPFQVHLAPQSMLSLARRWACSETTCILCWMGHVELYMYMYTYPRTLLLFRERRTKKVVTWAGG